MAFEKITIEEIARDMAMQQGYRDILITQTEANESLTRWQVTMTATRGGQVARLRADVVTQGDVVEEIGVYRVEPEVAQVDF